MERLTEEYNDILARMETYMGGPAMRIIISFVKDFLKICWHMQAFERFERRAEPVLMKEVDELIDKMTSFHSEMPHISRENKMRTLGTVYNMAVWVFNINKIIDASIIQREWLRIMKMFNEKCDRLSRS